MPYAKNAIVTLDMSMHSVALTAAHFPRALTQVLSPRLTNTTPPPNTHTHTLRTALEKCLQPQSTKHTTKPLQDAPWIKWKTTRCNS